MRVIVKQLCGLSDHDLIFPVTNVSTQRYITTTILCCVAPLLKFLTCPSPSLTFLNEIRYVLPFEETKQEVVDNGDAKAVIK